MNKWIIMATATESTLQEEMARVKIKYTPGSGIDLEYHFLTVFQMQCLQAALSFAQINKPFRAMQLLSASFRCVSKMDIRPIEEEKQEA